MDFERRYCDIAKKREKKRSNGKTKNEKKIGGRFRRCKLSNCRVGRLNEKKNKKRY